ncbi:MAG: DLW-39 family protein [Nocardiaceae bacterium]|nr:DLW-39 family protein [Nocardiaceae bacterium]
MKRVLLAGVLALIVATIVKLQSQRRGEDIWHEVTSRDL